MIAKPERSRRASTTIKNILLVLASTLMAVVICELLVRAIYPEYGVPVTTTKLFTEYDPLLGWRKIPNFSGTHIQDEYTVVEQFNSKSLRGPEYPYQKPEGEYRILIMGDSFAEGYTVDFQYLFSEVLKKKLNATLTTNVEVINAGTGGYSTDQELLFFQTEGKKYAPDLVLVLYYANDAPMNLQPYYRFLNRGWKPLFELTDGKLTLKQKPPRVPDRVKAEGGGQMLDQAFVPWRPRTWYLYRLYRHVWTKKSGTTINELPVDLVTMTAVDNRRFYPNHSYAGRLQDAWEITEALLAEIKKEAGDINADLLLYYVPLKKEIYGKNNRPSIHERNLRLLSQRRDIPLIPTVALFRQQADLLVRQNKRLYWEKDVHWTPEGHHLTGLILADYIISQQEKYGLKKD